MAASAGSEDGDLGFQIAPMVDVVFVLLLFFMMAASLKPKEIMLQARLPAPPGHSVPAPGVIRIDITEAGVVSVNDTRCGEEADHALPQLRTWLLNVMSFGSDDPVIIRPSPGTLQGRITDVLAACADVKVKNVAFN